VTDVSKYPAITIPASLSLPHIPRDPSQLYDYFRALHGVLASMQAANARAFDVLNFFRITMPPAGEGLESLPAANNSGSLYVDSETGRAFYDDKVTKPADWQEVIPGAVKIYDEEPTGDDLRIGEVAFWYETPSVGLSLTDADIDLSGTHDGNLVSAVTVADAMDVLDDLSASGGPIDDSDVDLSGYHTQLLSGASTVADAMVKLDDIRDVDILMAGRLGYSGNLWNMEHLGEAMDFLDDASWPPSSIYVLGFFYTGLLQGVSHLGDCLDILDALDDSDLDLSGSHTGILLGTSTVADAMTLLDDLDLADLNDVMVTGVSGGQVLWYDGGQTRWEAKSLDDSDVDLSGTHANLLSSETTVADAMDVLDDLSIEMPTRQQVMNGSKASVSDNTSTTIVTFTMPTGPSSFMAGLSFKGSSDDSTDAAAVWIQGVLKAVRVSGGTVTAEWIETINETFASGSETFGTCEVTANVSSADVQVKIQLDSSLDQSWDVKWTALMSDDVTVAAA
jgi:hypothetical protein